ncbi:expressed unknown protein [Seminavis robusta]|uniref:Mitochondrial ribonuclease P catalytic subunit n=1 Tax=Seminavis robusta TaxID=568900 RepID=A0A9N8HXG1_9STRA|nr:expressed unknown protein [Seminavis robusta]|eukprot:Sro2447_g327980.1 n/a (677) ;mRNA; f:1186-3216
MESDSPKKKPRVGDDPPNVQADPPNGQADPLNDPKTTPQNEPSKKSKRKKDPEVMAVRKKIQMCCKSNDLATALEVYRDALAKNIKIEAQSFYSLLNLCDGLERNRIHIGTPKQYGPLKNNGNSTTTNTAEVNDIEADNSKADNPEDTSTEDKTTTNSTETATKKPVDLETRQKAAFEIKEQMDEQKIPLNETAYSALVKLLSKAKQFEKANAILSEAEGVQQCRVKIRLYSSLLISYCQSGDLLQALEIWARLSQRELVLTEREYAALFDCCATVGDAIVMQKVLTDLSEDVLVPSRETCRAIVNWFESPFSSSSSTTDDDKTTTSQAILDKIVLPPSLQTYQTEPIGPVTTVSAGDATQKWQVSHGCGINTQTGTLEDGCLKGEQLQQVKLSTVAWQTMVEMNEKIVVSGKLDQDTSQFQGGKKGRKRTLGDRDQEDRKRMWQDFQNYLEREKQQRPKSASTTFDVVIDGANVGYFQTNYKGAPKHVEYQQIDTVVQHFLQLNKKILLVMHSRHFSPSLMPKRYRPMVASWERAGILCKSPPGMNDDWFWMHAALLSGPGTLVVTNDEMRDHHFQMLAPRSFLRWKEHHQVHFHFGEDENKPYDKKRPPRRDRAAVFMFPLVYSRRIQRVADGYAIPLPKMGDENRFLDGTHTVEDDAPEKETYLCIRPFPPAK